jgi:triosephosphate isomerase
MNPTTLKEALSLAKASDSKGISVAPPFLFIEEVGKQLKNASLGAQDLFWEDRGAFTGEVSAKELKSVGVAHVIIGHSERRHKFDETDEMVAKKMKAAIDNKLIPILCIGETLEERNMGKKEEVLKRQLVEGLSLVAGRRSLVKRLVVAYEPVWAIGTGNPESPQSAVSTIRHIKTFLEMKLNLPGVSVLYGGSVNSKILMDYLEYKEIDGALVGGASLDKGEVKKMIRLILKN